MVCGSFHKEEVEYMLREVRQRAQGLDHALLLEPTWVPGAFEVPLATKRLFDGGCDAVVTLGIIERGQTLHGQVMGQAVLSSLIELQLEYGRPVGLGIIGPGADPEHIEPRLLPHAKAAIDAVLHMLG